MWYIVDELDLGLDDFFFLEFLDWNAIVCCWELICWESRDNDDGHVYDYVNSLNVTYSIQTTMTSLSFSRKNGKLDLQAQIFHIDYDYRNRVPIKIVQDNANVMFFKHLQIDIV